jgi:hypothetical protein
VGGVGSSGLDPEGSVAGVGELRSETLGVSRTQAGKES